jgi:LacI family transcriptional regulator
VSRKQVRQELKASQMGKEENPLRATLEEVAADAGVSPTAVSLILRHGQKYRSHFRPETVERVFESARRLGYRSNLFAMSLNARESLFFALVLHTPAKGQLNSWITKVDVDELLVGAVEVASAAGVYPIVSMGEFDTRDLSAQSIVDLIGGGVFATLVQTPGSFLEESLRDRLGHGNLVAVVFPRCMAKWESNAIDADNVQIAEIAARLLTLQGRRRWMIVHEDAGCEGMTLRRATFERLASEAGIPVQCVQVPFGSDWSLIRDQLVEQVKRHHVDGLFVPTLATSLGSLHACRLLNLRPGEDLSIIGCDCDRWARGSFPQLTYVDISWTEAGRVATQKLLDLRGTREHRFQNILLPSRVVFGDTCPAPEGFPFVDAGGTPPSDAVSTQSDVAK